MTSSTQKPSDAPDTSSAVMSASVPSYDGSSDGNCDWDSDGRPTCAVDVTDPFSSFYANESGGVQQGGGGKKKSDCGNFVEDLLYYLDTWGDANTGRRMAKWATGDL